MKLCIIFLIWTWKMKILSVILSELKTSRNHCLSIKSVSPNLVFADLFFFNNFIFITLPHPICFLLAVWSWASYLASLVCFLCSEGAIRIRWVNTCLGLWTFSLLFKVGTSWSALAEVGLGLGTRLGLQRDTREMGQDYKAWRASWLPTLCPEHGILLFHFTLTFKMRACPGMDQ